MYVLLGVPGATIMNDAIHIIGVKILFIISGFLVTEIYFRDPNIMRYAIRRIFRIVPGYVFLIMITTFLIGPVVSSWSVREYFTSSGIWTYLNNLRFFIVFSLPGVFTDNLSQAVNRSIWAIPVEILTYILLPIMAWLSVKTIGLKFGLPLAGIMFILVNVVRILFIPEFAYVVYGTEVTSALILTVYFIIGCAFSSPYLRKLLDLQIASAILFVGLMLNMSGVKTTILMYVVMPYFVLSFCLHREPKFAYLFKKVDLSYGVFLYGFVIQQAVIHYAKGILISPNITFLASMVLTLLAATVSWYLVEKPGQSLGKKIVKRLEEHDHART